MTTQFSHDCPHCHTKASGFRMAFQWSISGRSDQANLLAICGVCNKGMTLISHCRGAHGNIVSNAVHYPGNEYRILETWTDSGLNLPESIPDNILSFYLQGLENLHASRWDAAGSMFRKTLDVSTKILSINDRKTTLFERINQLVKSGLLTPAMGDWSHEIRLDGNDAVHDDVPETEEDAIASKRFTEAFLTYAFSLPALVASNRVKREQEAA